MPFGTERVYQYSADIPAFNAVGGAMYWLEVFNDIHNDSWLWSTDTQTGNGFFSIGPGDWMPDVNNQTEFTFQLSRVVPEPSSVTLLALGAVGLAVMRWRG